MDELKIIQSFFLLVHVRMEDVCIGRVYQCGWAAKSVVAERNKFPSSFSSLLGSYRASRSREIVLHFIRTSYRDSRLHLYICTSVFMHKYTYVFIAKRLIVFIESINIYVA